MNKKILVLGIVGVLLLVGIVVPLATSNIGQSTNSNHKPMKGIPLFPEFGRQHIEGRGIGRAFKIGHFLFAIAKLPDENLILDKYFYTNPDANMTFPVAYVIAFRFFGDLIKQDDNFEFEGDAFFILYNIYDADAPEI